MHAVVDFQHRVDICAVTVARCGVTLKLTASLHAKGATTVSDTV